MNTGSPSLAAHVRTLALSRGPFYPRRGCCRHQPFGGHLLEKGHYEARLTRREWDRLNTWMDTYAQKRGSFDKAQEEALRACGGRWRTCWKARREVTESRVIELALAQVLRPMSW